MKSLAGLPRDELSPIDQNPPIFRVFVAYDGAKANHEAIQTCAYIEEQFADDCHVRRLMWDIDLFDAKRLREMAADDAALSDMIIVANSKTEVPSDAFKQWVELWRQKRNSGGALVALLNCPGAKSSPFIYRYLQDLAESTEMDFISKTTTSTHS